MIIKKETLEPIILKLLNRSTKVFEGKKFNRNEKQSRGESDYFDNNKTKYELKILFDDIQGRTLGKKDSDVETFLQLMVEELCEFSNRINNRDENLIEGMKLYEVVVKNLNAIKEDENIIFFLPFPISPSIEGSVIWEEMTDYPQAIYDRLEENELINGREFYYIYPAEDGCNYILRDPKRRIREKIPMQEFSGFVKFIRE